MPELKLATTAALAETLPPLSAQEAFVESTRCLFCFDAPCTHACPTHIDIPRFIKKISTGNLLGSARTILESNLLGATCARVCPVQELCEGACVLGSEHKPIAIGRLQRYATDYAYSQDTTAIFPTPAPTGRHVAVIGSGPASLSCAGELARRGHAVTVFEKRTLAGGLSTYGIIGLREPVDVSLAEVGFIYRLGVQFQSNVELCRDVHLADLQSRFDAVFLGVGLGAAPQLDIPDEHLIVDGLEYIEQSKLSPSQLQIGRRVLVIGAGNTAIDCATIARRLGAARVTIVYRRTADKMSAYPHEVEFARSEGIEFRFEARPTRVLHQSGVVTGLECGHFWLPADQIVKAIGQQKLSLAAQLNLETSAGHITVDRHFQTSLPNVFAGGDCIRSRGSCSTVMAVQDGKLAAAAIHHRLSEHRG